VTIVDLPPPPGFTPAEFLSASVPVLQRGTGIKSSARPEFAPRHPDPRNLLVKPGAKLALLQPSAKRADMQARSAATPPILSPLSKRLTGCGDYRLLVGGCAVADST
jgi:hypothetical protein